jgi:hypothetical protein
MTSPIIAAARLLDAIKASPVLPWSAKGAPICELLGLISMLSVAENRRRAEA